MDTRSENLLRIRPLIPSAKVYETMSDDEKFQNKTIRPIAKMQHDLLIELFKNYIAKRKNVFYELTLEKRFAYIEHSIQKDMKFRNVIKGTMIGQFTVEEYKIYIKNSSTLNKRIANIVKERLVNSIQIFEKPDFLKLV